MERAIGIRARQTEVIIDRDEDDEAIIEDVIPDAMGDLCHGISRQYTASIGTVEIHASCTAAAMRVFKILIRILVRASYMCPHRLHIRVPVLAATGSGSCFPPGTGSP